MLRCLVHSPLRPGVESALESGFRFSLTLSRACLRLVYLAHTSCFAALPVLPPRCAAVCPPPPPFSFFPPCCPSAWLFGISPLLHDLDVRPFFRDRPMPPRVPLPPAWCASPLSPLFPSLVRRECLVLTRTRPGVFCISICRFFSIDLYAAIAPAFVRLLVVSPVVESLSFCEITGPCLATLVSPSTLPPKDG